ncbi:hypothetical protein SPAN111604_05050 [Sphingomonas antarctica]|uniref:head GIN domain-containing protein n=1 Tax=Sphingomonas antarctica TaxID=2040274 RepID=UPI0039E7A787
MRVLIPLLALSACTAAGDTSTGTRSFPIPGNFDAVTLGGPANVRVVTGGTPSIVATGRNDDLDKIEIELKGSDLLVTRDGGAHFQLFGWGHNSHDVTVTVTVAKPISGATLKGSGDLNVDQGGGDRFDAMLKGSGDLTVAKVIAQTAKLSLMGSGDLKAGGQTRSVEAELAGSGGIDAAQLMAETAQVNLRGSGDVSAHATKSANVVLKGSGNVTIRGTGNCTSDKRGSGDVNCAP